MLVEHMRRDRARAGTETAVGLLQRDDIGVEFAEHRQHAAGVAAAVEPDALAHIVRSEEHTSELQSLMRISYAVFCLKKIKQNRTINNALRLQTTNTNTKI